MHNPGQDYNLSILKLQPMGAIHEVKVTPKLSGE